MKTECNVPSPCRGDRARRLYRERQPISPGTALIALEPEAVVPATECA